MHYLLTVIMSQPVYQVQVRTLMGAEVLTRSRTCSVLLLFFITLLTIHAFLVDPDKSENRAFYNGWIHDHGLKWQSVYLPCGMVIDIYGPVSIRHNDRFLIRDSDLNGCMALAQSHLPAAEHKVTCNGPFPAVLL